MHFWEYELSPSLISLSPHPQVIQKFFNAYWFGPPDGVTHPSTCPRVDHLVSRLLLPTIRPVQTRFRFGCRSEILNLAGKSNS